MAKHQDDNDAAPPQEEATPHANHQPTCPICGKVRDDISVESPPEYWPCKSHNGTGNAQSSNDHKEHIMNAAARTDTTRANTTTPKKGARTMKGSTNKGKVNKGGHLKAVKPTTAKEAQVDDRAITVLVEENPKRGESAKRFDYYKKAKTVQEYLAKGGTRSDLAWDVAHKFILITK